MVSNGTLFLNKRHTFTQWIQICPSDTYVLQDTSDLLYVKSVQQRDAVDASYCNYRFYSRHLNTGPKIKLNILKLHQALVGPFIGSIQLYFV